MYNHSKSRSLTAGSVTLNKGNIIVQAEQEINISLQVPADSTDLLVDLDLIVARIQSIWIVVDGGDLTVETNSSSVPADTINLTNKVPYDWDTNSYFSNLLTTDVTALYLTCDTAGVAIDFDLMCLVDPTP